MSTEETWVGIDLGTTNTEICKMADGQPRVILGLSNSRMTPSKIGVDLKSKENKPVFVIGTKLKNMSTKSPENVIYEPKRIIGRKFEDEYVKRDLHYWPFTIVNGEGGLPNYEVTVDNNHVHLSAVDASAEILRFVKGFVKEGTKNAVITVPSYFSVSQMRATADAGKKAGLIIHRCLAEPVAAAISYGYAKSIENETVLVYDLGGGTFDCCIVSIENGHYNILTSDGHSHLGGADFDNAIVKAVSDQLKAKNIDIYENKKDLSKLKEEAEKAKIALSNHTGHLIEINVIDPITSERITHSQNITRAEFNGMIKDRIDSTFVFIRRALDSAELKIGNIDRVILVGGSTRIPYVQERINSFFGIEVDPTIVNIDEAVAEGAAIYAQSLKADKILCNAWNPQDDDNKPKIIEEGQDDFPGIHPIDIIPHNIWFSSGQGFFKAFEQGRTWGDLRDGKKGIRLNRHVEAPYNYMNVVNIEIFAEDKNTHIKDIIARVSIDILDPRPASQCQLGVMMEYTKQGRLKVTITDPISSTKASGDVICRGDELDVTPESDNLKWRKRMEKRSDSLMRVLLTKGNNETFVKKRRELQDVMIWLMNDAIYADSQDLIEKNAELNDIENEYSYNCTNSEQTSSLTTVRVEFRKNRKPSTTPRGSFVDSLRSSHVKHTKEEEAIFTPNLHVDSVLRGSINLKVPTNSIRNSSIDCASTTISYISGETESVDEESIFEAAINDRKKQTEISKHNKDDNTLMHESKTEKEEKGPISSVADDDQGASVDDDYNPVIIIKSLPPYRTLPSSHRRKCLLPPKASGAPQYTLILDLDETMVHCSMDYLPSSDLAFPIDFDGVHYNVYANIRPFLFYLLKRVSPYYEIIIFTASQRCYADRLLDILDGENKIISHRLYRNDCLHICNNYIKDLNIVNRDLKKTVIVDNYISCFGYNLENGIPIISWFDDKSDHELYNLSTVLMSFLREDDIRPSIERLFRLKQMLHEFDVPC